MQNIKPNDLITDSEGKPSGILLIDKPIGMTSHDIVAKLRRILKTRVIGHAGTLDPFASGLLIILVGKATKLSDSFMGMGKEYVAEIVFGLSTNTHDPEGTISNDINTNINNELLLKTLEEFNGEYLQAVPVFSSVKVNGDKLRELARKYASFTIFDEVETQIITFNSEKGNKIVQVSKRKVSTNIKLLDFETKEIIINEVTHTKQVANIFVKCSKGTYIRQLAYDIGARLDVSAMLVNLRRVSIGDLSIDDSLSISQVEEIYS